MLNVAFSELKMKKGKVVLTNRGSIKIQHILKKLQRVGKPLVLALDHIKMVAV